MALSVLRNQAETSPQSTTPPAPPLCRNARPSAGDDSDLGWCARAASEALELGTLDFGRVYDSHGFGLVLMDMDGMFVQWNSTIQNLLGYTQESMRSLSFMHVTPVEDSPAMMALMQGVTNMAPADMPTTAAPMMMAKRCVTRSGEDLSVAVRLGVLNVEAPSGRTQQLMSCLIDCHGPHTWDLPTPQRRDQALPNMRLPMLQTDQRSITGPAPPAAAAPARRQPKTSGGSRRRVPLPAAAVADLRAALQQEKYPMPHVRQAISDKHSVDRKRVDRWLENARARISSKEREDSLVPKLEADFEKNLEEDLDRFAALAATESFQEQCAEAERIGTS